MSVARSKAGGRNLASGGLRENAFGRVFFLNVIAGYWFTSSWWRVKFRSEGEFVRSGAASAFTQGWAGNHVNVDDKFLKGLKHERNSKMLVLSRKIGERICIDGDISVEVLRCKNGRVKIGIVAPANKKIMRMERADHQDAAESPLTEDCALDLAMSS